MTDNGFLYLKRCKKKRLKEGFRESNLKRRERSSRTVLRRKIKALAADFNKRLLYPRKNEYIPQSLVSGVAGVLNALDLDSGKSAALSEKLAALKVQYDALLKSGKFQAGYDANIAEMIQNVAECSQGKFIELSRENLQYIYDTLKAIDKVAKDAVKTKIDGKEIKVRDIGNSLIHETAASKGIAGLRGKYLLAQLRPETVFNLFAGHSKDNTWNKVYNLLNEGQLKQTEILMDGIRLFSNLVSKENQKNLDGIISTKELVDVGLTDANGKNIPITRDMMNAIYMMLENEDNTRHLMYGGLTVPDLQDYYKGGSDAWGTKSVRAQLMSGEFVTKIRKINERMQALDEQKDHEEILKLKNQREQLIADGMTEVSRLKNCILFEMNEYDRQWIKQAKIFFDVFSKNHMNEVTLEVYGFEKATVNNYLPIHTDPNFRNVLFDVVQKGMTLENMGMTKNRVFSGSPVLLEGLTDIISGHLDNLAKYCGLMPAIKDFQKIYGKTTIDTANAKGVTSVQRALNEKFGSAGLKYVDNLIQDIVGSRQSEDGKLFNYLRGNMTQAVLSLNARVALAQAASYPTAAAEIGFEPLIKALIHGGRKNTIVSRADKELIAEYSPLLAYRLLGYSNTELGNIKELGRTRNKALQKTAFLMDWITQIDGATVGRLWYASQYYVDEQNADLKKAFDKASSEKGNISEEEYQTAKDNYYKEVARVFNRVIERTQPNYTIMQRPDVLRSKNAIVRAMTMFYTQRLQNVNILYDSYARMVRFSEDYKKDTASGVTKDDVVNARKAFGRACASQVVATVTLVAMKTAVDFLLHSLSSYRDPDDDVTVESVLGATGYNLLDSFMSNFLFGSEMLKFCKTVVEIVAGSYSPFENRDDFITLGGVDLINDLFDMFFYAGDILISYVKGESDTGDLEKAVWKLVKAIGTCIGVPINNAEKIVNAFIAWGDEIINGLPAFSHGQSNNSSSEFARFESAYMNKDAAEVRQIVGEMVFEEKEKLLSNGEDPSQRNSKGKIAVDEKARGNVRGEFTRKYKEEYQNAYLDKDTEKVSEIRTKLSFTGLYDDLDKTLEKWRKAADESLEKEERAKAYKAQK